MPSTQCVACSNPDLDAASRDASRSNRAIAREFGISEAAVRRHRANHVARPVAEPASTAEPRSAGRPSKFTPEREARLLSALQAGNTRSAACHYAGVDQDTLANWLAKYSDFSEAVKKAESDAEVRMVAQIAKAANVGTWQAAAWWLERRRADDYARRDRVDVTVRQHAQKLATEMGIDAGELIAEAERIISGT